MLNFFNPGARGDVYDKGFAVIARVPTGDDARAGWDAFDTGRNGEKLNERAQPEKELKWYGCAAEGRLMIS